MKKITFSCIVVAALLGPPAWVRADEKKADQAKPYPLKICVVSGEKLGGMGKEYVFTHEGQEVKLCCKSCLKEFKKDPAKYMKKIQEAEAKSKDKK